MASSDEARLKQIRIKTGVLKRLSKEKLSYEKETEQQAQRVAKMKEEGGDEYVIKKQEEALQETKMMITNSARMLATALDELEKALNSEKDLSEHQLYTDAAVAVEDAKKLLAVGNA